MKRRKKTNARRTSKRNRRPAQAGKNGASCCGFLHSITRTISPVLKALGIGKLK